MEPYARLMSAIELLDSRTMCPASGELTALASATH